jgi:hypothetical protein
VGVVDGQAGLTVEMSQLNLADSKPPDIQTLVLCLLRYAAPLDLEDTAEFWLEHHGLLVASRLKNKGTSWEVTPLGMEVAAEVSAVLIARLKAK